MAFPIPTMSKQTMVQNQFLWSLRVAMVVVAILGVCNIVSAESPAAKTSKKSHAKADEVASAVSPLSVRFAPGVATDEIPNFQKHVTPLMGRLGCNGRSCHGSFQGRGGFQLSLFGYDFQADHKAMLEAQSGRVDVANVDESLVLAKPSDEDLHEGGKLFDKGSWQYRVLQAWIAGGAEYQPKEQLKLERLDVQPKEVLFDRLGDTVALHATAYWNDGSAEDVTELCRFHTNDDAIAEIDETGLVSNTGTGDTHVVVSYDNAVVPIVVIRALSDQAGRNYPETNPRTQVDRLIAGKLQKLGIIPSELCTDAEFLRRANLDIAGTLPTEDETIAFLQDKNSDKRQRKIDELLESSGYAAWWTTRFCDWTGNSESQLNNVSPVRNAPAQHWYEWIYHRLSDNTPYDEIVEGIVVANSRNEGESYQQYCNAMTSACRKGQMDQFADRPGLTYYWARRNFRQPEDRAVGFAYAFLGIRIQCAQCHKHPFDQWSKQDFDQFKNLFQSVTLTNKPARGADLEQYQAMMNKVDPKLKGNDLRRLLAKRLADGEVIPFPELIERPIRTLSNKNKKKNGKSQPVAVPKAKLLGGDFVVLDQLAREKLMDWLRSPENPYFAKAIVNRVWANYFGIGIVDPVDDLNLANPPSNAPLMDYLAGGFIQSGYDLKWLHRTITNSDAYQRSWKANETNALDQRNFSRFVPRRLPAESLYDAILVATANDERATELCGTRDGRAIGIASSSPRNRRDPSGYALQVFGRSIRESNCDCDRTEDPSLLQTVYLQNDQDVMDRLFDRNGWLAQQMKQYGQPMPNANAAVAQAKLKAQRMRDQQIALLNKRKRELELTYKKLLPKLNGNDKRIDEAKKRYTKQRSSLDSKLATLNQQQEQERAKPLDDQQIQNFVTQAYLRTLSRYPEQSELDSSLAFVKSSDNAATGFGDVLWALLNTKEFMLNH